MKTIAVILILVSVGLATAAQAETRDTARASLTVVRSLQVGTLSPMLLRPVRDGGALGASTAFMTSEAPAVVRVSGDPRRAYSIRAAAVSENSFLESVTIQSANSGDLSAGGGSRMDAGGQDMLRISANYIPGAEVGRNSVIPLSIDYE